MIFPLGKDPIKEFEKKYIEGMSAERQMAYRVFKAIFLLHVTCYILAPFIFWGIIGIICSTYVGFVLIFIWPFYALLLVFRYIRAHFDPDYEHHATDPILKEPGKYVFDVKRFGTPEDRVLKYFGGSNPSAFNAAISAFRRYVRQEYGKKNDEFIVLVGKDKVTFADRPRDCDLDWIVENQWENYLKEFRTGKIVGNYTCGKLIYG